MGKKKRVAMIGHFGGNENILDGQTVKTKILYEELSKSTDWRIKKVDTYLKNKKPFTLLWQTVLSLLTIKNVIVLLSGNGMKVYFPILYFSARFLRTRIYHDVIGGNLDSYMMKNKEFKKYLNAFAVNWVETNGLKNKLGELGITNCEVLPNFKRLNCVRETELPKGYREPYRFCTFSRVMKEKGIEDAIDAIAGVNRNEVRTVCTLDIYGKIEDGYQVRFNEVIKGAPSAVQYCGTVSYDQSVEVIKKYYALLFPTYWDGEGFPGTLMDAFSAGLPVIATDWNCNREIVDNMKDGILYPNDSIQTLQEAIEWSVKNSKAFMKMKVNCIKKAGIYQPEKYISRIISRIEE